MNPPHAPLVIAHRGESRDAPENTLAAVRLAWERGAGAVEIDVRRSADDQVVVVHDPDLRRLGGVRLAVASSTLEQLRGCDVGAWKHRRWAGERLPLLADVLATVPDGGVLFIEIKVGPEIVPALARTLRAHAPRNGRLIVMSFHRSTLAAARVALPGVELALLLTARQWVGGGVEAAIAAARALGCSALDVERHHRLTRPVVDAVHRADLALYVWTVNRLSTARRLAGCGIDGITTDRCAWLRARLGDDRGVG